MPRRANQQALGPLQAQRQDAQKHPPSLPSSPHPGWTAGRTAPQPDVPPAYWYPKPPIEHDKNQADRANALRSFIVAKVDSEDSVDSKAHSQSNKNQQRGNLYLFGKAMQSHTNNNHNPHQQQITVQNTSLLVFVQYHFSISYFLLLCGGQI